MAQREESGVAGMGWLVLIGLGALAVGAVKKFFVVPAETKKYTERMRIGKIYAVHVKNDSIEFKFPIENPNSTPMTIDAIVGDVYVSDRKKQTVKLGTVAHYGHNVIKAVGATDFDLVVKIKLVNEFVYLSQLLNGNWKGQVFTFIGTINANGHPWPVKESIVVA